MSGVLVGRDIEGAAGKGHLLTSDVPHSREEQSRPPFHGGRIVTSIASIPSVVGPVDSAGRLPKAVPQPRLPERVETSRSL